MSLILIIITCVLFLILIIVLGINNAETKDEQPITFAIGCMVAATIGVLLTFELTHNSSIEEGALRHLQHPEQFDVQYTSFKINDSTTIYSDTCLILKPKD